MAHKEMAELSAALRESEVADYAQAWSMPKSYYTDPEVFALERDHLFGTEWICIGRSDEVANPGDMMPFQLCEEPLVAVRGPDGVLRAFSNVCRHRGAMLVERSGNAPRVVCPYHHWSYDYEGKLAGAPRLERHKGFDPSSCRLPRFACEEWNGFIFVNMSADAAPLAPRLEGLGQLIRNYHMEQMKTRYVVNETWPVNWKCFIENFMEGYHLSPLHRTTLHPMNPTRLCTHIPPGDAYFGYNAGFSPDLPRSYKGHPDLTDAEAMNCVMMAIPPGLVSGCSGDYSSFICVQPEAVDRVRVKMGLLFFGDSWKQRDVDYAVELFHQYMGEDKDVLAALARGLRSRHYHKGPLAPEDFEGSVLDFYRYYSRRMREKLSERAGY
jgi:phenylpropionate dioxygenase-like ring-hydroxylating dioxygenase large terminal subunit